MSISLLTGSGANQLPNTSSAAAKKADDSSQRAMVRLSGDEKAATSLTLAQDNRLISAPEANGNVDDTAVSRSNIEAALIAVLESETASGDTAPIDADAIKIEQAKQTYEDAISGPVSATSNVADNVANLQQDPFASSQSAGAGLSKVA